MRSIIKQYMTLHNDYNKTKIIIYNVNNETTIVLHPLISAKITELVALGITDVCEMKRALKVYVTTQLCNESPSLTDREFYPCKIDNRNHIFSAKIAMNLSKLDQENLGYTN